MRCAVASRLLAARSITPLPHCRLAILRHVSRDTRAPLTPTFADLASARSGSKAPTPVTSPPAAPPAVAPSDPSPALVPGTSARSIAGLPRSTVAAWRAKASVGASHPVVWDNPGAYAQVSRVPEDVLGALPPPRRPLWPMPDSELTWRYARILGMSLFLAGLAAYVHAKARLGSGGAARAELERLAPSLARALVAAGLLADYTHVLEEGAGAGSGGEGGAGAGHPVPARGLDRALLLSRVFARFADAPPAAMPAGAARNNGSGTLEPTLPLSRALTLLALLRGEPLGEGLSPALRACLEESGLLPGSLAAAQFLRLAQLATQAVPPAALYSAASASLGVTPASAPSLRALRELFEELAAGRTSGAAFTPAQLLELVNDVGLNADADAAADALAGCAAARAMGKGGGIAPDASVALSPDEFADFCVAAAAAASIRDERLPDYIRVFRMLHLSGMRQAAGVAPH